MLMALRVCTLLCLIVPIAWKKGAVVQVEGAQGMKSEIHQIYRGFGHTYLALRQPHSGGYRDSVVRRAFFGLVD